MNEELEIFGDAGCAMDCPRSAVSDVLAEIRSNHLHRRLIFASDDKSLILFIEETKFAVPVDIGGEFELELPDCKSAIVVYIHAEMRGSAVSQIYDYFKACRCLYDTAFVILKEPDFQFSYAPKVHRLHLKTVYVGYVRHIEPARAIIYSRTAEDYPNGAVRITARTSIAEIYGIFKRFVALEVQTIFATVPLPFSTDNVYVVTLSNEVAAKIRNLGFRVHVMLTTENTLLLERYGIQMETPDDEQENTADESLLATSVPNQEKNADIIRLFSASNQVKIHELVQWKLLIGQELAGFVVNTIGFTNVTWAQKTLIEHAKTLRSIMLPYNSTFKPGNGVTFGVLIACLWICKHELYDCIIISKRYKWEEVFVALESSSISGVLKRLRLVADLMEIDGKFSGLTVSFSDNGVRMQFS